MPMPGASLLQHGLCEEESSAPAPDDEPTPHGTSREWGSCTVHVYLRDVRLQSWARAGIGEHRPLRPNKPIMKPEYFIIQPEHAGCLDVISACPFLSLEHLGVVLSDISMDLHQSRNKLVFNIAEFRKGDMHQAIIPALRAWPKRWRSLH